MNDIPYQGDFYAMVKFNNLPSNSYSLEADTSSMGAYMNLAWTIDSAGTWSMIAPPSDNPCVFLCRATVINYMDQSLNASNTNLIGYNVYRSGPGGTLPYLKRNENTFSGNTYVDHIPGPSWTQWNYFVTAVYQNLSDSSILCEPHSDTSKIIYVGMHENSLDQWSIYPNPAEYFVCISSPDPLTKVEIYDQLGRVVYLDGTLETKSMKIDLHAIDPGIWVLRITSIKEIRSEKIMIIR